MNPWFAAACATSAALLPCAAMCLHGTAERRLVGLNMSGILVIIDFVLLTMAFNRAPFLDLALALAILSFGSGLVFARFLEKHL